MLQFQEIRVEEIIIVLNSSYVKKQEEKYDDIDNWLTTRYYGHSTIDCSGASASYI